MSMFSLVAFMSLVFTVSVLSALGFNFGCAHQSAELSQHQGDSSSFYEIRRDGYQIDGGLLVLQLSGSAVHSIWLSSSVHRFLLQATRFLACAAYGMHRQVLKILIRIIAIVPRGIRIFGAQLLLRVLKLSELDCR